MQDRIRNIIQELIKAKATTPTLPKVAKPKEEDPSHKVTMINGEPHVLVKGKRGYTLQKQGSKVHSKYLPPDTNLSKLFDIDIEK
jgi:hypothetical protein